MNEEEKGEAIDETSDEEVVSQDVEVVTEDNETTNDAEITEGQIVTDDVVGEPAELEENTEQQLIQEIPEIVVEPVVEFDTQLIADAITATVAKEHTSELVEVGEQKLELIHQVSSGDILVCALLTANLVVNLLARLIRGR